MFVLRRWQEEALERVKDIPRSIIEACVGSGKSAFSGALAKHWLESCGCGHVLAVVPSISIKRGMMRQWRSHFGLKVRSSLWRSVSDAVTLPDGFDATVITYHKLQSKNSQDVLGLWKREGMPFGVVLDEIHHAAETQSWGERVKDLGRDLADWVCIMTGTPFRADGQPIEMMRYVMKDDGNSIADPHYRYTYRQAVEDDVCRPVTCRWFDGTVKLVHQKLGSYEKNFRELQEWERAKAAEAIFDPDGPTMANMLRQVHGDLMRLRENKEYADAAALLVCRPARDEKGEKHGIRIAQLWKKISGDEPVFVSHDDPESAEKIDAFARSQAKCIVAINMVSEGVDIPRLRFEAFCRDTDSEMLFRQISGRVLRTTKDKDQHASQIYAVALPKMLEYGGRLWQEAEAGLKHKEIRCFPPDGDKDGAGEPKTPEAPKLVAVSADGLPGAGRFDSTDVELDYIHHAEQLQRRHSTYRTMNPVHMGAMLKDYESVKDCAKPGVVDIQQHRSNLCSRLNRVIKVLARRRDRDNYERNPGQAIGLTWFKEVYSKHSDVQCLDDIRTLWTEDKMEALIADIERAIHKCVAHAGGAK